MDTSLKISKNTVPGVFIIESLELDDEIGPREGIFISNTLEMSGIDNKYRYVRTKCELKYFIDEFVDSEFRFLHISCHGNESNICTTFDEISHEELGEILSGKLKYRRLFMSACATVNESLAKNVIRKSGCNSIVGPDQKVNMDEIAIFWVSFYHLMFKTNPSTMKKINLISTLDVLAKLYLIPVKYYKKSTKTPFYTEQQLAQGKSKPRLTDFDQD